MRVITAQHTAQGRRGNNEDSSFAGTLSTRSGRQIHVVAVADGVGGGERGEEASALVIEELHRFLEHQSIEEADALTALLPAWADETNRKVQDLAETEDSLVGTTLSALLVCGSSSLLVHIGDSAVQAVSKGRCQMLTTPHNSGWGIDEDLMDGPQRRSLERCFGLSGIELDLVENPIALDEPCRIIASSDGMHEKVPSATIAQFARADGTLDELAQDLVAWSLAAGSKDNSTVALMQIGEPATAGRKPAFPTSGTTTPSAGGHGRRRGVSERRLFALAAVLIVLATVLSAVTYFHWRKGGDGKPPAPQPEPPIVQPATNLTDTGQEGAGAALGQRATNSTPTPRADALRIIREQNDVLLPNGGE
jgi:PPM family protein phosphatase